jgi:hypothetical protein
MIGLEGSKTTFRITNNHFMPWFWSGFPSSGYAISTYTSLGPTDVGHTIYNNHFEPNPSDTRPEAEKNKNFMLAPIETLKACKIGGNIGDGVIWCLSGRAATHACGLDLSEKGIEPALPGSTSYRVEFLHSLLDDTYIVTVAFNWNDGGWWISNKTRTGFNINWNTRAPGDTPQLEWSAKHNP